jgi:hypothetical protein
MFDVCSVHLPPDTLFLFDLRELTHTSLCLFLAGTFGPPPNSTARPVVVYPKA